MNHKINNDMKKIFIYILLTLSFLLLKTPIYADYVLPYPSFMPGNKMYKVMRILDQVKKYWYWGNIAQIKYHMELSDKYLVEAKTLMEYNQYLLATDALIRSDKEFMQLPQYVQGAKNEHVEIDRYKQLITEASQKHKDVLSALLLLVPREFTWSPEKVKATDLKLHDMLNTSIKLRSSVLDDMTSL
jgi:hypothetical protein